LGFFSKNKSVRGNNPELKSLTARDNFLLGKYTQSAQNDLQSITSKFWSEYNQVPLKIDEIDPAAQKKVKADLTGMKNIFVKAAASI